MSIVLDGTTGITTPAETVSGAVTAATVTATGLISGATNYTGFKNRIINGAMMIDQRNAGASVANTAGNQYTLDRFQVLTSVSSKFTVQQNAGGVTPPTGFSKYLGITSSSAYAIGAGDYFLIGQLIEGFNTADLAFGTANAKSITLSFQVYSSLTGTFGGALQNSSSNRCYPFSYSIPTANTWTTISITVAGDTTGTWVGATNGVGLSVWFGLGVGSTLSATAGAWGTSGFSATGATSVVGTSGATFYITGVQLEKGSTATSFDYRPYGTELALCQRYYEKSYPIGTVVPTNSTNSGLAFATSSAAVASGSQIGFVKFSVAKRASPTMTVYSYTSSTSGAISNGGGTDLAASSGLTNSISEFSFNVANSSGGAATPSFNGFFFHWVASSEL